MENMNLISEVNLISETRKIIDQDITSDIVDKLISMIESRYTDDINDLIEYTLENKDAYKLEDLDKINFIEIFKTKNHYTININHYYDEGNHDRMGIVYVIYDDFKTGPIRTLY